MRLTFVAFQLLDGLPWNLTFHLEASSHPKISILWFLTKYVESQRLSHQPQTVNILNISTGIVSVLMLPFSSKRCCAWVQPLRAASMAVDFFFYHRWNEKKRSLCILSRRSKWKWGKAGAEMNWAAWIQPVMKNKKVKENDEPLQALSLEEREGEERHRGRQSYEPLV